MDTNFVLHAGKIISNKEWKLFILILFHFVLMRLAIQKLHLLFFKSSAWIMSPSTNCIWEHYVEAMQSVIIQLKCAKEEKEKAVINALKPINCFKGYNVKIVEIFYARNVVKNTIILPNVMNKKTGEILLRILPVLWWYWTIKHVQAVSKQYKNLLAVIL